MGVLNFLKSITGNYGFSIIIFASLIKLALYYPTQKQYQSMKEMQKIQPLIKKLQQKYKDDPQKMQMEQMTLFKKYNINPLGGCLPLIIQMPILIGIFMTIRKMAELGQFTGEKFLWIGGTLSRIYPDFIGSSLASRDVPLLLIYAASMYFSQKMTVSDPSAEGTQKIMGTVMPLMFTFILWRFPSSLILYWLVFNMLSIVQQYMVMKKQGDEISGEDEESEEPNITESRNESSDKKKSRSRKKKGGK